MLVLVWVMIGGGGLSYSWRRKREPISLTWMLPSPTPRKSVSLPF